MRSWAYPGDVVGLGNGGRSVAVEIAVPLTVGALAERLAVVRAAQEARLPEAGIFGLVDDREQCPPRTRGLLAARNGVVPGVGAGVQAVRVGGHQCTIFPEKTNGQPPLPTAD